MLVFQDQICFHKSARGKKGSYGRPGEFGRGQPALEAVEAPCRIDVDERQKKVALQVIEMGIVDGRRGAGALIAIDLAGEGRGYGAFLDRRGLSAKTT